MYHLNKLYESNANKILWINPKLEKKIHLQKKYVLL